MRKQKYHKVGTFAHVQMNVKNLISSSVALNDLHIIYTQDFPLLLFSVWRSGPQLAVFPTLHTSMDKTPSKIKCSHPRLHVFQVSVGSDAYLLLNVSFVKTQTLLGPSVKCEQVCLFGLALIKKTVSCESFGPDCLK